MRAFLMATIMLTLHGEPIAVQPPVPGSASVSVNSQKSLTEIVGGEFAGDAAWESPKEILPADFPGLAYVSGPAVADLSPKGAWRKPVVLRDKDAGVEVAINCYRARDKKDEAEKGTVLGSPFIPLSELDLKYAKVEFHALKAARASNEEQDVFAFRDGDLLFKVQASGGKPEARRKAVGSAADAVWKFRHPK